MRPTSVGRCDLNIALRIPGRKKTQGIPDPRRYLRKGRCVRCGWCCLKEECAELMRLDDGYACGVFHSPDRPIKCKLYPDDPPVLNPACGYFWLDRWDGDKIVKLPKDMV